MRTERVTMSPPLCKAACLELGWDMQIQPICLPAPSGATEQHAASCTHPLTYAQCRRLEGSSLVSRSHTCLRMRVPVCANVQSSGFPRDTLTLSILLPSVFLSPPPAHLCVVFLAPLPLPSLFSHNFPFCSAPCVQTVAGARAE